MWVRLLVFIASGLTYCLHLSEVFGSAGDTVFFWKCFNSVPVRNGKTFCPVSIHVDVACVGAAALSDFWQGWVTWTLLPPKLQGVKGEATGTCLGRAQAQDLSGCRITLCGISVSERTSSWASCVRRDALSCCLQLHYKLRFCRCDPCAVDISMCLWGKIREVVQLLRISRGNSGLPWVSPWEEGRGDSNFVGVSSAPPVGKVHTVI